MIESILFFFIISLFPLSLHSENKFQLSYSSDKTLKYVIGSAAIGSISYLTYRKLQDYWWDEDEYSFHFRNDNNYAQNFDKIGHFYANKFITETFASLFYLMDFKEIDSYYYGFWTSFFFGALIEIKDGKTKYGFSIPDLLCSSLGAYFPYHINKNKNSFLADVKIKIYYQKSSYRKNYNFDIFQDYEGMKYWFLYPLNKIFNTDKLKSLNAGFGIGLTRDSNNIRRKTLYFGFDISPTELFNIKKNPVSNLLLENFHFTKFSDMEIIK